MRETNTELDQGMSGASCFLLGLAIGSGAALLFAPMRGRTMRHMIGKKANEGREAVASGMKQGMEKARQGVDKASGAARDAKAFVDLGKQRLMQEHERLEAAVKAGKHAYSKLNGVSEGASA